MVRYCRGLVFFVSFVFLCLVWSGIMMRGTRGLRERANSNDSTLDSYSIHGDLDVVVKKTVAEVC